MELKVLLQHLDNQNKGFYQTLNSEERKKVSLWVMMRYMSSSSRHPEHSLLMVNELVNRDFTALSKHPELQWMLLSLCGIKEKTFHPWVAPPGRAKGKNKLQDALIEIYPTMKSDEIDLLLDISSEEELRDILASSGYQDKEIDDIIK